MVDRATVLDPFPQRHLAGWGIYGHSPGRQSGKGQLVHCAAWSAAASSSRCCSRFALRSRHSWQSAENGVSDEAQGSAAQRRPFVRDTRGQA